MSWLAVLSEDNQIRVFWGVLAVLFACGWFGMAEDTYHTRRVS